LSFSSHNSPFRSQISTESEISWAVLLAHWTDFARASVALPVDGEGRRWRSVVADVIGLQAITFALQDIGRIASEDRPAAIARAGLGVREYAKKLVCVWQGELLPVGLTDLIADARKALAIAESTYANS